MAAPIKPALKQHDRRIGEPEPDFLDSFYDKKICEIPATSTKVKQDIFDVLRPKPKTVLDYKISQTDTKMQKRLARGYAKVHVQQTTARYKLPPPGYVFPEDQLPPPEPPTRPVQYFQGRGPVWEFADDIWRRKVEQRQKLYHQQLKKLKASNRAFESNKIAQGHIRLMKLVGPDWYQELSPNQLKAVDNLKNGLLKDLKFKTIINTQANIAELGLVLRPNSEHVRTALNQCCECPVEFLLILYQLMNRHRVEYSLNDRLLLSGVVHLTMRETLKELHVRIPSPPPVSEKPKPPPKIKKEKRYKSPYLVPFTFVRPPPKHTGIYKNNQIQYPESPYFSYISELKAEAADAEIEPERKDREGNPITRIMITPTQTGITEEQAKEIVGELRSAQEIYNKLAEDEPAPYLHKPLIYIPCDHGLDKFGLEQEEREGGIGSSEEQITDSCICKIAFEKLSSRGVDTTVTAGSTSVSSCGNYSEEGFDQGKPGPSVNAQAQNVASMKTIGVVTENIANANEIDETNRSLNGEPTKQESVRKQSNVKVFSDNTGSDNSNLISVSKREADCKCKDEITKIVEDAQEATCTCLEKLQEKVKKYEEMKQRFQAQHDLKSLQKQYIVGGLQQGPQGPVYMLSGVLPERECRCIHEYQEWLKEKARLENMPQPPHGIYKYVISGVRETPEGNVYVMSGTVPREDCTCMKMYKEFEEKHSTCLEAYQQYLKKIEIDTKEYMEELANDERYTDTDITTTMPWTEDKQEDKQSIVSACFTPSPVMNTSENLKQSVGSEQLCPCGGTIIKEEIQEDNNDNCPCGELTDCICRGDQEPGVEEEEEEKYGLKRFIILEKISCDLQEHQEILKHALSVLAEDGYPLAKLPECYKLPHFKLWMQLRCGKFWTQEDRMKYLVQSWIHWRHLEYCNRKVTQSAKLDMPKHIANKYTWIHADVVRRIATEKDNSYYRELRQAVIGDGREFFPSTFSYEFPTPNFRDCFFAYIPPKEEECIAWRPWYPHEIKNLKRRG